MGDLIKEDAFLPPNKRLKNLQASNSHSEETARDVAVLEGEIVEDENAVIEPLCRASGKAGLNSREECAKDEQMPAPASVPALAPASAPVPAPAPTAASDTCIGQKRTSVAITRDDDEDTHRDRGTPEKQEAVPKTKDVNETSNGNLPGKESEPHTVTLDASVAEALMTLYKKNIFTPKDIDARILDFLASLSREAALAALDDIERRDFTAVRNKPAFIMSIFKRVTFGDRLRGRPRGAPRRGGHDRYGSSRSLAPPHQGQQHQYGPICVPPSALAHLPVAVADMLQRVFASGVCHPSQFDDRAMDELVTMREDKAVHALSEFASMNPGSVRNPSAFWMGLARKYKSTAGGPPFSYGAAAHQASESCGGVTPSLDAPVQMPEPDAIGPRYTQIDQRIDELVATRQLRPGVVDGRARDALLHLREDDALAVLDDITRDPERVRNMSAYIVGLCRKFASGQARGLVRTPLRGNYGPLPVGSPTLMSGNKGQVSETTQEKVHDLEPSVQGRYVAMIQEGLLLEHSFDARALETLKKMRPEEACLVLDELAASYPRRLSNVSAYFMGIARKFTRRT